MLVATATTDRSGKHVYATLDGIRGVAAALIAVRHAGLLFPGWEFPHSALAVDMFFVISGFVIASAYDRKLADGLTPAGFMRIRLIRLYPLYLAGLLLGFGAGALGWLSGTDPRLSPGILAIPFLLGLVILPSPTTLSTFPLNPPSWSLFLELAVNYVYAVAYRRVTTRRLVAIAAIAGTILLAMTLGDRNLEEGHNWDHFFDIGFVRVTYSFAIGLLLFRVPRRTTISSRWCLAVLALAAITLAMPKQGAWYPLVAITLWMPALVFLATIIEPGAMVRRACHLLGRVSYPLYVLHAPAAVITAWTLASIGIARPGLAVGLAFLIAMMAIALMADRYFSAWFGPGKRPKGKPLDRGSDGLGDLEPAAIRAPNDRFGRPAERLPTS